MRSYEAGSDTDDEVTLDPLAVDVDEQDHYTVLGLQPGATKRDIRAAYRKYALRWHPDKNDGDEEAAAKFRRVKHAHDCLTGAQESSEEEGLQPDDIAANRREYADKMAEWEIEEDEQVGLDGTRYYSLADYYVDRKVTRALHLT